MNLRLMIPTVSGFFVTMRFIGVRIRFRWFARLSIAMTRSQRSRALFAFFAERQVNVASASEDELLAFYSHLLETYYKKCRDAIKKVAPNKLYLGSRLHDGALRKEAFSAAAKYCDVVSVNVYEKDVKDVQCTR